MTDTFAENAKDKQIAENANCSGWMPIESAPKDGASILGAYFNQPWRNSHREGDVVKCWYQPEFDAFISACREMTMAPGFTFDDGTTRQLHSPTIEEITHWMPLPPPPPEDV